MAQMIEVGREFLRINSQKNTIEYSKDGRNWARRGGPFMKGILNDICLFGQCIYAATSKGICYTKDNGVNWSYKTQTTAYGEFQSLTVSGTILYAQTSKGLYYSKDGGTNWSKR